MEKKIEDYLHMYIGCKLERGGIATHKLLAAADEAAFDAYLDFKPILRPLASMTEDEWKKCFELSRGMVDQSISDKIKKIAHNEILVTLGYKQFSFGFHYGEYDNDVRIGHGTSFYLKSYLIKDELSVSEEGIEENQSHFNHPTEERIFNWDHIFLYLLSKHFDLFGLIESGLALDSTQQPLIQ